MHDHLKKQLISDLQTPSLASDTIQKINDRYFSIFVMTNIGKSYSKKILAVTKIKNNLIKFTYELKTNKKDSIADNFLRNSVNFIKTIHIEKKA